MKVLLVEDNAIKQSDIKRVIKKINYNAEIEWQRDLKSACETLQENKYDLIVTDMWYPALPGGEDNESGTELIEFAKENNINTPLIVCSSIQYRIPGILGAIKYNKDSNWDIEMLDLVRSII